MIINLLDWFICYLGIMLCMCIDNLTWIPADYKWYGTNDWRPYFKVIFIFRNKEYLIPVTKEGFKICLSRIKAVLTHQYDIVPAIITSFIISIIFNILL